MPNKPWYQSKTIWAGIVTAIIGLYNTLAPLKALPKIPEEVYALLGALGIYSRATSTTTIGDTK